MHALFLGWKSIKTNATRARSWLHNRCMLLRAKLSPAGVLLCFGGIRNFVVLKPEPKPIEVSVVNGKSVRGLPFDVIFVGEHDHLDRSTGILEGHEIESGFH